MCSFSVARLHVCRRRSWRRRWRRFGMFWNSYCIPWQVHNLFFRSSATTAAKAVTSAASVPKRPGADAELAWSSGRREDMKFCGRWTCFILRGDPIKLLVCSDFSLNLCVFLIALDFTVLGKYKEFLNWFAVNVLKNDFKFLSNFFDWFSSRCNKSTKSFIVSEPHWQINR